MGKRTIIDPITRIEGHLRIEVDMEGGKVKEALSSGTLFRGFETILKNRDPRDAGLLTQRICGVCTHVHYDVSVRAVENALRVKPPANARIVRNLIKAAQYISDHIVHFYVLHGLDWIDVTKVLTADPKKAEDLAIAAGSTYNSGRAHLAEVKKKIETLVKSGQLGPFANGYWGHPAYKEPPEATLLIVSHYLDALEIQRLGGQIMAILCGKDPHTQGLVVGGVTCVKDILDPTRLGEVMFRFGKLKTFVDTAYIPDLLLAGSVYKDIGAQNIGAGHKNFLSYGDFPLSDSDDRASFFFPSGVVLNGDISKVIPFSPDKVSEHAKHSWYKYQDESKGLHPKEGVTEPHYTGLNADGTCKENEKYSWVKAPRYDNKPMEVGPLARVVIAYVSGNKEIRALVDYALKTLNVPASVLFSTLGRTAARALETKYISDNTQKWFGELITNLKTNEETSTRYTMPNSAEGFGLIEAPRGALGHWISIKDQKIANYQIVVPSTWNFSPKDANNVRGACEQSLLGTPCVDADKPIEVLRTVHSFDPCLACAVHTVRR